MHLVIESQTKEGEVIDKVVSMTGERVVLKFSEDSKEWFDFNISPAKLYTLLMNSVDKKDRPKRINGHGFKWSDDAEDSK